MFHSHTNMKIPCHIILHHRIARIIILPCVAYNHRPIDLFTMFCTTQTFQVNILSAISLKEWTIRLYVTLCGTYNYKLYKFTWLFFVLQYSFHLSYIVYENFGSFPCEVIHCIFHFLVPNLNKLPFRVTNSMTDPLQQFRWWLRQSLVNSLVSDPLMSSDMGVKVG